MELYRWQLRRIKNESSNHIHDLIEDKVYSIGRHRDNSIILASLLVSRRHCRIEKDGSALAIIDNGSENGTFINETRIAKPNVPHSLKAGDLIGIGVPSYEDKTSFVFQVEHFPPSTVNAPDYVPNDPSPSLAAACLCKSSSSERSSRDDTRIKTGGANPAQNVSLIASAITERTVVPVQELPTSAVGKAMPRSRAANNILPKQECQPSFFDGTNLKVHNSGPIKVDSPRNSGVADKLPISKGPDLSESLSNVEKLRQFKRKQVREAQNTDTSGDCSAKRPRHESANKSPKKVGVSSISDNSSKKQENSDITSDSYAFKMVSDDVECIEISDSDSENSNDRAVNVKAQKKEDVPSRIHEVTSFSEVVQILSQFNPDVDSSANDLKLQVKAEKLNSGNEQDVREKCGVSLEGLSPIPALAEDQLLSVNPTRTEFKIEPEDTEPLGCDGKDGKLNDSFMEMIDRMAGDSGLKDEVLEKSQYSMQEIEYIIITDDEDEGMFPASQLFTNPKQEPDMSDNDEYEVKNFENDVDGRESPDCIIEEEDEDSCDGWYEKLSQATSKKDVPLKVFQIAEILGRADKLKHGEDSKILSDSDSDDGIISRKSIHKKTCQKKMVFDSSSDNELSPAVPMAKKATSASSISRMSPVPTPRLSTPNEQSDSDSDGSLFEVGPTRGQKDMSKIQDIERSRVEQLEKLKPVVIDAFPLPSRRGRHRRIDTREDKQNVKKKTKGLRKSNAKNNELLKQGKKRIEEEQKKKLEEENKALLLKEQCAAEGVPVIVGKRRVSSVTSRPSKGLVKKCDTENSRKNNNSKSKSKVDSVEDLKILRNERLKEIAAKAIAKKLQDAADADPEKKIYQKPLIKVTENNRGAFLVNEVAGTSTILPKPVKVLPKISDLARIPKLKRSVPPINGEISTAHSRTAATPKHKAIAESPPITKELSRRNSEPLTSVVGRGPRSNSLLSETGTSRMTSQSYGSDPPQKSNAHHNLNANASSSKAPIIVQTENRSAKSCAYGFPKSCLRPPLFKGTKKNIRWNDKKLCEIQVVDRYISQMASQPVGNLKDVPPPNDHRAQDMHFGCPNLYETISNVCCWNTEWLTQQATNGPPPPVNNKDTQFPMLTQFSSYADYCKVVRPLMILDLWASIWKDSIENENCKPLLIGLDKVQCSKNYITNNKYLDSIECHGLLSAEDNRLNRHPRVGDLVLFELVLEKDEATGQPKRAPPGVSNVAPITASRTVRISFAYVIEARKIPFTENSLGHIELFAKVPNARFCVQLRLLAKRREYVICFHSITRLKVVSSIRSKLRTFEALEYLERSPLCKFILNPIEQDYSLPQVDVSAFAQFDVLSMGRLNDEQRAAVLKTSTACLMDKPKICLIQGPPGTGKSLVIVNLLFHILQSIAFRKQKILFCAPSNAAVDEIVIRFLNVQKNMEKHRQFKIVRIGNPGRMDPTVRSVSLDELAAKRLNKRQDFETLDSVTLELNTLQAKCRKVELELDFAQRNSRDTEALSKKLANYQQNIKNIRMGRVVEKSPYDKYVERCEAESFVLDETNIVAVTLSSSASSVMEKLAGNGLPQFKCCIVDEASQCSEPDCLLPLMQGMQTLVLVGDPKQLPATTHSQAAKKLGFDQSLLSRLSRCFSDEHCNPIQLLTQQYRMHPEILKWPNNMFYENQLITPLEVNRASPLRPYRICRHDFKQSSGNFTNHKEAELVILLVRCVLKVLMDHNLALNIGIITPYSKQRFKILGMLKQFGLEEIVAVNTIDGYQGKERDVIIMSCVRTQGTGFMSDAQRLNVSLTRARFSMIICANFQSLEGDPLWKSLKDDGSVRTASFQLSPQHMQNGKSLESELLLF